MPAGIVSYGVYIPRYRIRAEEIARDWGEREDMARNLNVFEKSVPDFDEDAVTIGVEAARNAVRRGSVDPGRIVGQIITGIGFIGAGVILTRQGIVVGVTSASVIWVLAGIGILIGFQRYLTAIAISLLVVVILTGINFLESSFRILRKGIYERFPFHKKKDTHSKTEDPPI